MSECQHCHQPVQYGQPTDTAYKAFAHVATNTAACPADPTPEPQVDVVATLQNWA